MKLQYTMDRWDFNELVDMANEAPIENEGIVTGWASLKTLEDSLRESLRHGDMVVRAAAIELCKAGRFNYVPDDEQVLNYLGI